MHSKNRHELVPGAARLRGAVLCTVALFAFLLVFFNASVALAAPASGLTAFRGSVLDEINEQRDIAGVPDLQPNYALDVATQNHAEYLVQNGHEWGSPSFSAHNEIPSLPGFWAVTPADRDTKAGYPWWEACEDVVLWQGANEPSPQTLIGFWIDAPLHRRAVLDRQLEDLGFGWAIAGSYSAYVLDTGRQTPPSPGGDEVQVYPVEGQEDVPVSWEGFESPNPFPGLAYPCGYVVTAFPTNPLEDFTSVSLTLTEADGTPVPTVQSSEADYAFAPVHPLDPGVSHTACLSYTLVGGWLSGRTSATYTWSFTTLAQRFNDVGGEDPYATAIYALSKEGIITGYPDGAFRPDNLVSRQQFAKMVVKTLGLPVAGAEVCPFTDVGTNMDPSDPNYPEKYVAVCAANGITQGKTPSTFAPYDNISRQQLITMIARAANLPEPPADYTPNFSPGQFYPLEHYENARKAAYAGLLDGLQGIAPSYNFLGASTRGETAQLLWNLRAE